jgi:16S rRNA (cytosine967-C5)-methyltransferase
MSGPHGKGRSRKPLDPARQAAFDVLRAVSQRDAAFATELAYGACRALGLLDAVIVHAANRPVDRIDPVLLDLLRLGTYQLLRTRVDAHAAVDTTVEQAAIEFDTARAGFVNGALRTIAARDEQSWVAELAPPTSPSPMHIPGGSDSRSPTPSVRMPRSSAHFSPATTTAPWCIWPRGPAC